MQLQSVKVRLTFLPTFSNLNSINDTTHPQLHKVKTGQKRPPLWRSAGLSQAADSPECWWDGKLTETKVAISDSDRCLLVRVAELGFGPPGEQSSSLFGRDRVWSVYYMSSFIEAKPRNWPTHLHRGVGLQGRLTNALTKGVTNLWDSQHSAAAVAAAVLSVVTLKTKLDSSRYILVYKQNVPYGMKSLDFM